MLLDRYLIITGVVLWIPDQVGNDMRDSMKQTIQLVIRTF